ncbi:MAG: hypothetical protein LV480_10670 [Methylacidiphilales bacterium]|nr:hypothetical protein [Candidatus Methylacidiphilales bacterium]
MQRASPSLRRWMLAACMAFLAASPALAQVANLIAGRPPSTGPTQVKTGLYYIDISEIDGATETFTATAYLLLEWSDPRLRFAPKEENEVRLYKPDEIWTPAVEIVNAEKLEDQQPPTCTVTSDGTVYYLHRVVTLLNTRMDLRRFPFDRQQLNFIIESSRFGSGDLVFVPDPDQSGLGKDIVPRGWSYAPLSWKVVDQPFAQTDQTYSRLIFSCEATRNSFYFIWKIIFPTAVFVFLTWSVFWMQVHDVQTALVVAITVLLTAVAFGNVTDSLLPKLGYRTWLDQFQLGSFLFIVSAVIETITVHNLNLGGNATSAVKVRKLLRVLYPAFYLLFCSVLFLIALN